MSTPNAPTRFSVGIPRPVYNTGTGCFIAGGTLYDANGNEFRMRGVNRVHYDSNSAAGIAKSGANAVRFTFYLTSVGADKYMSVMQADHIANKQVVIPSLFYFPDGTRTTGSTSTTELSAGVSWWVANAMVFKPLEKYMIVNIANEWGPSNSTVWRDSYIAAIAQMRAAGYLGTLLIDSGGYGQDIMDLTTYATAVFNSDAQKNVMFGFHLYGNTTPAQMPTYFAALAALSKSAGLVFAITEFGPGKNIGPSPTMITPGQVITTAETNNLGWLAWAWDDNNLANAMANDAWFSMTYHVGIYTQTPDLTLYGQDVVLNPSYGLQALAHPASLF